MNDPLATDPVASLSQYLNAIKSEPGKARAWLSGALGTFVALMGFGVIFLIWKRSDPDPNIEGLFSGFAFWGLMLTIWIQMKQLRETKVDLKRTTDAHEASAMLEGHGALVRGVLAQIEQVDRTQSRLIALRARYHKTSHGKTIDEGLAIAKETRRNLLRTLVIHTLRIQEIVKKADPGLDECARKHDSNLPQVKDGLSEKNFPSTDYPN